MTDLRGTVDSWDALAQVPCPVKQPHSSLRQPQDVVSACCSASSRAFRMRRSGRELRTEPSNRSGVDVQPAPGDEGVSACAAGEEAEQTAGMPSWTLHQIS